MKSKSKKSVLFLGRKSNPGDIHHCDRAISFCQSNFETVSVYLGDWGQPLPEETSQWNGDYIISYLSRWVVPAGLLERAKIAAINFHPASPDYPGIGCNNFALYDEAKEYGATCHHMYAKVDTGGIIAVKRFPLLKEDNVSSLLTKTYDHMIVLFHEIIGGILEGKPLPESDEKWARPPYSRKQFNELCRISPDMPREEIARKIRATRFGKWKPTVDIAGFTFELKD